MGSKRFIIIAVAAVLALSCSPMLSAQTRTTKQTDEAARAENAHLRARTRELESRLTESEAELAQVRDALWISEAAEKRARAALVAVEQVLEDGGRHLRPA